MSLLFYAVGALLILGRVRVCILGGSARTPMDNFMMFLLGAGIVGLLTEAGVYIYESRRVYHRWLRDQCLECGTPLGPKGGRCPVCREARQRSRKPLRAFPVVVRRSIKRAER